MTNQPLVAQDVRAAAEVHGELGAAYQDAVIEAFLEKIDAKIDARVDARLTGRNLRRPSRTRDPARRATWQTLLAGAAIGAVSVGVPLSLAVRSLLAQSGGSSSKGLVVVWVLGTAAAVGI